MNIPAEVVIGTEASGHCFLLSRGVLGEGHCFKAENKEMKFCEIAVKVEAAPYHFQSKRLFSSAGRV
jgi:hypothetical protein